MTSSDVDDVPVREADPADAADPYEPAPTFVPTYRHRWTWVETILSSAFGLVAAVVLSLDALTLAANPNAIFACDISAKISCAVVGKSWQASLLGDLPNAYLGQMAEPVIITVAAAGLAGVVFPRWFMLAAQVVSGIGLLFAYWLFEQAALSIKVLCPWCLAVTITTTLIFVAFTRINLLDGRFGERARLASQRLILFYHLDWVVNILVITAIAAIVIFNYL
jgi:uncharacterized membrane protein